MTAPSKSLSRRTASSARGGLRGLARRAAALLLLSLTLAAGVQAQDETPSSEPTTLGEAPLFSAGPFQYRPGRGLRLGSTGVVIGGFTMIKAEETPAGGEFSLDNLNFFLIFDRIEHFRAVAELQLMDLFSASGEQTGTQNFAFDVRRLFGEYTFSNELRLRAGTFLTPVGYWNLILAPPLTWTTENPLIVERTFFQPTTTGLMLHGATPGLGGQVGYALFSQLLQPLQQDPDLEPPKFTAGARLNYDYGPAWSGNLTYQGAESHDGEWTHMGAVDALWQGQRGEILSELYVQDGSALPSAQWGTYLQGVIEVVEPVYLVGRYERYDQPKPLPTLNLYTAGAVWKPYPFMALKVEYRYVDHNPVEDNTLKGFFTSFTTFF